MNTITRLVDGLRFVDEIVNELTNGESKTHVNAHFVLLTYLSPGDAVSTR